MNILLQDKDSLPKKKPVFPSTMSRPGRQTNKRQHEIRVDSASIALFLRQLTVEEVAPVHNAKRLEAFYTKHAPDTIYLTTGISSLETLRPSWSAYMHRVQCEKKKSNRQALEFYEKAQQ